MFGYFHGLKAHFLDHRCPSCSTGGYRLLHVPEQVFTRWGQALHEGGGVLTVLSCMGLVSRCVALCCAMLCCVCVGVGVCVCVCAVLRFLVLCHVVFVFYFVVFVFVFVLCCVALCNVVLCFAV